MGTHGPNFNPRSHTFSQQRPQTALWMRDYYDDSILDADDQFRRLIDALRRKRLLDNTIVILNSDHGAGYESRRRIPLMLRFPGGEYAGRLRANTQNLDIGATILDYLGIDRPQWLGGRSLLSHLDPRHVIMSAAVKASGIVKDARTLGIFRMDSSLIGPPFYALGALHAIVCDRFYSLDLTKGSLLHGEIPEHTQPCATTDLPSTETVEQALVDHLAANRWDVSSLRLPLPRQPMNPLLTEPLRESDDNAQR
jgi:hypothetical protein